MKKLSLMTKRAGAFALAAAMTLGCTLGASAAPAAHIQKDETVYVTLAADGGCKTITDSVWLHSDDGLAGYTAHTGLTGLTMLKDTAAPAVNGADVTFAEGCDAYYQGGTSAQLPITAQITYTLDGEELTAEQLAGKSGHLCLHIAFANHTGQMQTLGGQKRNICVPFVTVAAAVLDTDTFTNVRAENGMVQTDSAKDLVAFVCLPGLRQSVDGLLTGELADLSDKLYDEVTLEADVTDFQMPMLYIAAATDAASLAKEDALSDFDTLFDELDGLDEKLDEVTEGIEALLQGSDELNGGANQLYDGAKTLADGAASLQTGARQVADGAASAAAGADTLSGGLATLSGKSQSLRDGAAQLADGVLASVQAQLVSAGYPAEQVQAITLEDTSVLEGWMSAIPEAQAANIRAQAIAQVKAAAAAQGTALDDAGAQTILNVASALLASGAQTDYSAALVRAAAMAAQAQGDAPSIQAAMQALAAAQQAGSVVNGVDSVKAVCTAKVTPQVEAAVRQQVTEQVRSQALAAVLASSGLTQEQYDALPEDDATRAAILAAVEANTGSAVIDAAMQGDAAQAAIAQGVADHLPAAYAAIRAAVVQAGAAEAQADLVVVYGCGLFAADQQNGGALYQNSPEAAISDGAARLQNAQTVQSAAGDDTLISTIYHTTADAALQTALTSLRGAKGLRDGVNQYTAGVDTAATGAATLASGLNTLKTGSAQLADGADALKAGADKLLSGVGDLKTGTATLADGVRTLYAGVDEAVAELKDHSADLSVEQLETLKDTLEAVKARRQAYTSFAGDAADEGKVKFVMKVSAEPQAAPAAVEAEAAAPASAAGGKLAQFWQRLLALFGR